MKRLVALAVILSALACHAPDPWPRHCRGCGKALQVGRPKNSEYRPICVRCWAGGVA